MNLDPLSQARAARVGNLAGWAVAFLTRDQARAPVPAEAALVISHADYFARIEASLPGDLTGGRFSVSIEAMTDAHYRVARAAAAAELYLFWQDVNSSIGSYFSGLAGFQQSASRAQLTPALVARFAIRRAGRGLGLRGGDAVFEGRDWAYERLASNHVPLVCVDSLDALLRIIATHAGITISSEPRGGSLMPPGTPPEAEKTGSGGERSTCLSEVQALTERIAAGLRGDAPSVALLRHGALHLGRRSIPFPAGEVPVLDYASGLASAVAESGGEATQASRNWRLLLRGRPDLHPGGVARFKAPAEEAVTTVPSAGLALAGALSGLASGFGGAEAPDTTVYITSVTHRLSRTAGFQTEVTALQLDVEGALPPNPWTLFEREAGAVPARAPRSGDTASQVGRQVRDLARSVFMRLRLPEVAEIRSATAAPPATPAMTLKTWEGTTGNAGESNTLRRHPIARGDRAVQREAVASLSPFAWGACGLALPRYPGMRVMLGYRNGNHADPFEMGATWGPGQRMNPRPGDWWLCLPRDASTSALENGDMQGHEPGPDAKATHDLIDAAGNRVIQVGKLTLRIGQDDNAKAGTRPTSHGAAFAICHSDTKAVISMDQDGVITITGKNITLDAGTDGKVSIKAKDVDISVQNRVSVT
ncbi:hypothetical protein [Sabulicella rubraurantiaca]|uniref:hypothetical protein n=1 Tax=Sabulicella rubraurantiaca TaxID=2811429 RepID=UPI001A97AB55|nr:hypothetical protein [Sabulicella rubraurantiaca]